MGDAVCLNMLDMDWINRENCLDYARRHPRGQQTAYELTISKMMAACVQIGYYIEEDIFRAAVWMLDVYINMKKPESQEFAQWGLVSLLIQVKMHSDYAYWEDAGVNLLTCLKCLLGKTHKEIMKLEWTLLRAFEYNANVKKPQIEFIPRRKSKR